MQSNKSRDTKPELAVRSRLHALGLRYRVCARPLPDLRRRADIVFRPAKVAVEVRGCFWHGCAEHYTRPTSHSDFWDAKVRANLLRDRDTEQRLVAAGWELIVVWEHEDPEVAAAHIAKTVRLRRPV